MIPEAAVEAAARALCGVTPEAWESQATHTKDTYRWEAIAALEAAAPHMLAGAWDDGWDAHQQHANAIQYGTDYPEPNPFRSQA